MALMCSLSSQLDDLDARMYDAQLIAFLFTVRSAAAGSNYVYRMP